MFSVARPGLWNKPIEKEDLPKHKHTHRGKTLMPRKGKARELQSVHVLYFFVLVFFISQCKCSVVYVP